MAVRNKLSVDRVVIAPGRVDPKAHWEFQGKVVKGSIHHYMAMDGNLPSIVPWWFILHVPDRLQKGGYLLLQALDFPRIPAWTPIARTVINYAKATMTKHRGSVYAKVRLAASDKHQKYENVGWDQRKILPDYLQAFDLRAKSKVATTRGNDGDSLVAVIPGADHAQMIRFFVATKVWPLHPGLPAATRKAVHREGAR